MKMKTLRRKPASIAKTRWAAYAAAGAATALVGSNSAEAAIHYSGDLHEQFGPHKGKFKTFPLDQAGDFFQFVLSFGEPSFGITGIVEQGFRGFTYIGYSSIHYYYVSKLPKGSNISAGHFSSRGGAGILVNPARSYRAEWANPGIGFVGFNFNNGAGVQYGWVRVRMSKLPENAFTVLDYAYADPGEPISAGQRSSAERAPDQGSLGWLAAGAVGLLAWRKSRSRRVNKLSGAGTDT
jgi:hypothetical protein